MSTQTKNKNGSAPMQAENEATGFSPSKFADRHGVAAVVARRARMQRRSPYGCSELAVQFERDGKPSRAVVAWKAAADCSLGSSRRADYLQRAQIARDVAREQRREKMGVNRYQYVWSKCDPMPEAREDGDECRVAVEDALGFRFVSYTFSAGSGRWEEDGRGIDGAEAEKLRPVFIAIGPLGWGQAKDPAKALGQYVKANGRGGLKAVKVYIAHPQTDIYGDGSWGYPAGARPKEIGTGATIKAARV